MLIRLAYMGHGYHQAVHFPERLELSDSADVAQALGVIQQLTANQFTLPPTCLVIVNGRHLGTVARCDSCVLHEGDELALLAPVAGG